MFNCHQGVHSPQNISVSDFCARTPTVPEHVVEGDVSPVVEPFDLVAHVFEEETVLLQVDLEPPAQQPQHELHPSHGDDALYKAPWQ